MLRAGRAIPESPRTPRPFHRSRYGGSADIRPVARASPPLYRFGPPARRGRGCRQGPSVPSRVARGIPTESGRRARDTCQCIPTVKAARRDGSAPEIHQPDRLRDQIQQRPHSWPDSLEAAGALPQDVFDPIQGRRCRACRPPLRRCRAPARSRRGSVARNAAAPELLARARSCCPGPFAPGPSTRREWRHRWGECRGPRERWPAPPSTLPASIHDESRPPDRHCASLRPGDDDATSPASAPSRIAATRKTASTDRSDIRTTGPKLPGTPLESHQKGRSALATDGRAEARPCASADHDDAQERPQKLAVSAGAPLSQPFGFIRLFGHVERPIVEDPAGMPRRTFSGKS